MEGKKGLNRRDFLRTAALATAATAVPFIRTGEAQGAPLKIGLIGCGGRGRDAAKNNALDADKNVTITAIHDIFEDRVKRFQRELAQSKGVKVPDDRVFWDLDGYKKLLQTDVDYVILATPPGFRPEHFEAAVDAKKHIFTEKPVATDMVGVRRFMAAAKKSEQMKLSVVAGTQRRHQRNYVETIEKIHDGAIGDVLAVRAYWCGGPVINIPGPRPAGMSDLEYQVKNWYSHCWVSGDNIVEQHVHNLDVINWVMGAHPVSVFASGGRAWKTKEEYLGNIWDHFSCDYAYPNGVHMLSMSRHWNGSDGDVSEYAVGTKRGSNCADMGGGGRNPYVQEHMDLIASIRGTGRYYNEAMQVAESVMTAIMGRESAYTGKRLRWDEFMQADLDLLPKNMSWDAKIPVRPIPVPGQKRW
jgi:predicted dehydrogenase